MEENVTIWCKQCKGVLTKQGKGYFCISCSKAYPLQDGILIMEPYSRDINLRMSNKLLNLHELRDKRRYYSSFIKSNVEYYARLHSVNFSNFHAELLLPYLKGSTIVDLGCGQLPYINSFPSNGIKTYYGLDLDYKSLTIAKNNFKKKFPLVLIQHGVKDTPFPDNSIDIVVSSEVLEHLDEPLNYLQEIYRICKKGGYLSLSTPCVSMYFYPYNFLLFLRNPHFRKRWYKQINAHKYWSEALNWHPGLRPKILKDWVNKVGFSVIRHETRLWFYHTPTRLMWRLFYFLEKLGITSSGEIFYRYLKFTDKMLSLNLLLIKWLGIRQFILCKKEDSHEK